MLNTEKKQLFSLVVITFMSFLGMSLPYPLLAPLFLHPQAHGFIHLSASLKNICFGLAIGSYPLGQCFGAPIVGYFADTLGRKKILLISLALSTVGYCICALSIYYHNIIVFLLARFFTGLFESNVTITRAMASSLTLNQHKSLGAISSAGSIAYIVGPLLAGLISLIHLKHLASAVLVFIVGAALVLLTLTISLLFLSDDKAIAKITNKKISINPYKQIKRWMSHETLMPIIIASTVFSFAVDCFFDFSPMLLVKTWHFSTAHIAIISSIEFLFLALGCIYLVKWLANYLPCTKALYIFSPLFALCLMLFIAIKSVLVLMILFALIGLILAITTTNFFVYAASKIDNENKGSLFGSLWSLRMFNNAIIATVGGLIIIVHASLPVIIASCAAIAAPLLLRLQRGNHVT